MMPSCDNRTGVYCIQQISTKKRYIGSTGNSFSQRWRFHLRQLMAGQHHSKRLQQAWQSTGSRDFVFTVVAVCSREDCIRAEQAWIDHFDSAAVDRGFNVAAVAKQTRGPAFELIVPLLKDNYGDGRVWLSVNEAAARLECPRYRVVRMIDYGIAVARDASPIRLQCVIEGRALLTNERWLNEFLVAYRRALNAMKGIPVDTGIELAMEQQTT